MQLAGRRLKVHYPKLTVMRGVEHTISLFFYDVSNIPIVNQMIYFHKMIYDIIGSGIYHKPHSIFKSKSQEFHNRKIGLFSGNETIMDGYLTGMNRDLRMRKVIQDTISSTEFISIPNNNRLTKSVRYVYDNNSWERCYVILNILRVLCLADSNLAGMDKVYYYLIITKQCIKTTISDIDYQRLFPDIFSPANTRI